MPFFEIFERRQTLRLPEEIGVFGGLVWIKFSGFKGYAHETGLTFRGMKKLIPECRDLEGYEPGHMAKIYDGSKPVIGILTGTRPAVAQSDEVINFLSVVNLHPRRSVSESLVYVNKSPLINNVTLCPGFVLSETQSGLVVAKYGQKFEISFSGPKVNAYGV
jgi:hypothetical protein